MKDEDGDDEGLSEVGQKVEAGDLVSDWEPPGA